MRCALGAHGRELRLFARCFPIWQSDAGNRSVLHGICRYGKAMQDGSCALYAHLRLSRDYVKSCAARELPCSSDAAKTVHFVRSRCHNGKIRSKRAPDLHRFAITVHSAQRALSRDIPKSPWFVRGVARAQCGRSCYHGFEKKPFAHTQHIHIIMRLI